MLLNRFWDFVEKKNSLKRKKKEKVKCLMEVIKLKQEKTKNSRFETIKKRGFLTIDLSLKLVPTDLEGLT